MGRERGKLARAAEIHPQQPARGLLPGGGRFRSKARAWSLRRLGSCDGKPSMTRQFLREARLVVGDAAGQGLDLSALKLTFRGDPA